MNSLNDSEIDKNEARPRPRESVTEKIGLPRGTPWGIVATTIFVVGDALEVTWISSFFSSDIGIALSQAAWIITVFGIVTAVASYAVGPLVMVMGPRKVMFLGFIGWIVADILFIAVALPTQNYWLILVTYAIRGVGTPLFAFAFVTWLNARALAGREARTQAWFWFCISGGQQIIGAAIAATLLPVIGPIHTLWVGLGIAIIGGLIGVTLVRDPEDAKVQPTSTSFAESFASAVSIVWREPRVGVGAIVKLINIAGIFAMMVFYVPYLTTEIGIPVGNAVLTFTILGITGVPGNLVWGWLSDRLGWANTIQWVASPVNAIAIALLYFVPQWIGPNFVAISALMLFWGIGTSAYVPLSALVPALVAKREQPAALGTVTLATGVGQLIGPAIVAALLPMIGFQGVAWAVVGMYVLSLLLMFYVQLPGRARTTASISPEDEKVTS
ncbi:MFS transporter [Microbacterium sp. MPKO10]|uniref:MFS transporter n=1 Tax=Microbacterium sp. MPKO10 TaxID=2989818 RepID=UPI002235A1E1|nr:MFS transporter [Microbacterium sp. MPKO10]MCW4457674.1 MFS transporter [Microbacterium sp. MPKO10]